MWLFRRRRSPKRISEAIPNPSRKERSSYYIHIDHLTLLLN
jgi:hypothetical protein